MKLACCHTLVLSCLSVLADNPADRSFLAAFAERDPTSLSGMGDGWFQTVLPFDLDGDGDEDCLSCDANGGDGFWCFHERTASGWNLFRPNAEGTHDHDGARYNPWLRLQERSFFSYEATNAPVRLLCIEQVEERDPESDLVTAAVTNVVSFRLSGGVHEIRVLTNAVESLIASPEFSALRRVLPTMYRGTNQVAMTTEWWGYTNLSPSVTGRSLSAGERTALRSALDACGETGVVSCAVCDADGDGRADAYASARNGLPPEAASDWILWLQGSEGWFPATAPAENRGLSKRRDPEHPTHFLMAWEDPRTIAPLAYGSLLDFYRVRRPDGTVWPAVFPRGTDGSVSEAYHRLFEDGAAFMSIERLVPENLCP